MKNSAEIVLSQFIDLCKKDLWEIDFKNDLPNIPSPVVEGVLLKSKKIFSKEPTLLRIDGPLYIIGDLHGNLFDFINILQNIGLPNNTKMLFLGDYVDRGSYSFEVIINLLAMKCSYPDNVFMIRGNHEVRSVNSAYGFKKQVDEMYGGEIWEYFNEVFDYLPLAAIINNKVFAVHGGLSPKLESVEIINSIKRPIRCDSVSEKDRTEIYSIILDLLWSDPVKAIANFVPSSRGNGSCFGSVAAKNFLKKNNLETIIRAHQCVEKGVSKWWSGLLYTVFSSSDYSPSDENYAGVCSINDNLICAYRMPKKENIMTKSKPSIVSITESKKTKRRNSISSIADLIPTNALTIPESPLMPSARKVIGTPKRICCSLGRRPSSRKITLPLTSFMF
jgi:serine/threonine-protein phosphatase PP1 catalytic subunit